MVPDHATSSSRSLTTSRRSAVAGASALALSGSARAGAQYATQPVGEAITAGKPEPGANAFEFVGVVQQLGLDFTLAGYVTNLAGIDSTLLFDGADPLSRSEATARLAMTGSAAGTARSTLQNLFAVNAEGSVQFSPIEPGASFERPESFTSGTPATSCSVVIQDIINVQAPQVGNANGFGTLAIESTEPFTLDGQEIVIGEPGARFRISFVGQGALHNPETLAATIFVVGNGVLAG